jgi:hypothetical protein
MRGCTKKLVINSLIYLVLLAHAPFPANATIQPNITITSISAQTINPGESVSWTFDINLPTGSSFSVGGFIEDPQGITHGLSFDIAGSKRETSSNLVQAVGTFYSHNEIQPGKYKLKRVWLSTSGALTEIRDLDATETNYGSGQSNKSTQKDLSSFSFTISDVGKYQKYSAMQIERVFIEKTTSDNSENFYLTAELSGESYLSFFYFAWKDSGGNSYTTYCHMYPNNGPVNACNVKSSVLRKSYTITIPIVIPKDAPGGINTILNFGVDSRSGLSGVPGNSSSYMWGSRASYDIQTSTLNLDGKNTPSQIDFSNLTFANLATTVDLSRSPTWTNATWEKSTISAGSTATFLISINASKRKIFQLSLYNLIGTSPENSQYQELGLSGIRRIDDSSANGLYPGTSSGEFAIDVWIPRSTKPGIYKIGQLSVYSTICDFQNQNDLNGLSKENGFGCQDGVNTWNTTYNNGYLSSPIWPGYKSLDDLKLEVTTPVAPSPPTLTKLKVDSSSIDFKLDQDLKFEYQNCQLISSVGKTEFTYDFSDQSRHVIISGLEPDSDVKFEVDCVTSDGLSVKSGQILVHTSKPTPPSAPSLTFQNQTSSSLKLKFDPEPEIVYNAQSSSGNVTIRNGLVTVMNYDPTSKITISLSATDKYLQTTIGKNEEYLPAAPSIPFLNYVKQDSKVMYFSYSPKEGLRYIVSSSAGKVIDNLGKVQIIGIGKGVRTTVRLTAIDKFQQRTNSRVTSILFRGKN